MGDDPHSPAPAVRIDLERVSDGIDMLPCLTRVVFLMHRWDGLSYDEIAGRCGISPDEVMHRMVTALSTIRRCCDGDRLLTAPIRMVFRPMRVAWYAWQRRRTDRRLGL